MNKTLPLFLHFCLFSMMAVGGASAILPEIHRQAVEVSHWLTSAEFASLYAVTQAAPGPNVLIVSLIGWKVAGIPGAIISTVGMCGPSSVFAYHIGKLWFRFRHSPMRRAIEQGLAPITIGLVLGSAWLLVRAASSHWQHYGVALAAAAATYFSRRQPLWWLAIAAIMGMAGIL